MTSPTFLPLSPSTVAPKPPIHFGDSEDLVSNDTMEKFRIVVNKRFGLVICLQCRIVLTGNPESHMNTSHKTKMTSEERDSIIDIKEEAVCSKEEGQQGVPIQG